MSSGMDNHEEHQRSEYYEKDSASKAVARIDMRDVREHVHRSERERFDRLRPLCSGSTRIVDDLRWDIDPISITRFILVGWCDVCQHIIPVSYDSRDPNTHYRFKYHTTNGVPH